MTEERPESDIRKRAAWLLAMLAVVAGLFVLLSVTLFNTSGGGGTSHGDIADPPTDSSTPAAGPTPSGSTARPTVPASTSAAPGTSAPSGSVPTPSCSGTASCAVRGDVAGAMSAINAYRAQQGRKAVPTTSSPAADRCALTSGNDCPSSFVWVRVTDLSGSGVVTAVTRFSSRGDLIDKTAKSYEVGWAYEPGSKTISCALIRND